jgi:sec-independent protein translocase protein TatC
VPRGVCTSVKFIMSEKQPTTESFSIWDHLGELRKRLFVILGGFLVCFIICLVFSAQLLEFLLIPIRSEMERVYFLAPQEAFFVNLRAAFFFGIIFSSPFTIFHAWKFLEPGLLLKEKKVFIPVFFATTFLFVGGVAFAFFVVLPTAMEFFLGFASENLKPFISVGKYIGFASTLSLGFGITFVLPMCLLALMRMGTFTREQLARQRPILLVVILILAAVFTPPDVFSQMALALPLWILF